MTDSPIKKAAASFPALLSGALVALAFPKADLFYLAWIALVPLLLSLWGKKGREAFLSGYLFGIAFFFGTLYWIYHSIAYYGGVSLISSILVVFLLCAYLALYPALFTLGFAALLRRSKLPAVLIAPVLWTTLEFVRSYALTGFPWSSLGYSQYRFLPMIQMADITGIYGVSFLVVAVNAAVVDLFFLKRRIQQMPLLPVSYTAIGIASVVLALAASLGYGAWRLGQERPGRLISAAIIQGNIEQDKKWEPGYQKEVLDIYAGLSRDAARTAPGLIVWPETAVPFFFGFDRENSAKLLEIQKELNTPLLFGSVLVRERTRERTLLANSAILLDREGKTAYEYDKIHLVPFGEYVPLRSILFFLDKLVAGIGDYVPGDKHQKAEAEFGSFGTLICYEIIFPGQVRKFYTGGGDFIATITNDAWFGKTAGPYQHFSMAVFRAVENRKPVLRAANTGISGLIDSSGRILASSALFTRGVMAGSFKADQTMTFYTKYGDLFSFFCIVISIVMTMNIIYRR